MHCFRYNIKPYKHYFFAELCKVVVLFISIHSRKCAILLLEGKLYCLFGMRFFCIFILKTKNGTRKQYLSCLICFSLQDGIAMKEKKTLKMAKMLNGESLVPNKT